MDFDLTPFDQELLDLAREQGLIARTYARRYDYAGALFPDELPEAKDQPDVRAMLEARAAETSGFILMESMLYLEETWGTIPLRKSSNRSSFLGSKLLRVLGTPEQIAHWGRQDMAIALTEPGAGSDPSMIRATALRDPVTGEWILNGEKIFISLAHTCQSVLVLALYVDASEKGMGTFVVEKGTPGFEVGPPLDKLGQRGWDTANLRFTDCRLATQCRLAGSMRSTLAVFNESRPYVAAIGLGYARAALDFTRDCLAKAGYEFAYHKGSASLSAAVDRFMRLEAMYEAAKLTFIHAKWVEQTSRADKIEAAMSKASGGIAARRITQGCLEILGPESASEQHLLEMWFRDARICDIYEGPGEVNRLLIARELLGYSAADLR